MSALAVSQIQKHFQTNQIYKRSKRYFDVIKLNSIENHNSKYRRKPLQQCTEVIQKKIQQSFMSSEDFYNQRRLQQIEKSRRKSSFYPDDKDETETNQSEITKYNLSMIKKGFDMGKVLPRQFYQNLQNHNSIEDPFDNFVFSDFGKGPKGKSIDFNKILGRKDTINNNDIVTLKKLQSQQLNPQNIQSQRNRQIKSSSSTFDPVKIYQKYVFDQATFKCLFDVEKQKRAQQRRASLHTSLKYNEPKQLDLQKIEKGRNFSRKKPNGSNIIFYHGKGKQQPSQIHLKTMKKNENYWLEQLKIMKEEDFEIVKRREEMIQKKMKQIREKKDVNDDRKEICDAKYFLRQKQKQKRISGKISN